MDKRTKDIKKMQKNISNHKNDIWIPKVKLRENTLNTNTWFSISEFESLENNVIMNDLPVKNYKTEKLKTVKYCSKKILLFPTYEQKKYFNNWLNAYLIMYNVALKYIKNNYTKNKNVFNFIHLRNILYDEKQKIIKNSSIKVHDIDYAVKLACQNYKTSFKQYKKGHIKHFRIRYWKKNKDSKLVDLEKDNFSKDGIRCSLLGSIVGYYNGQKYNFDNIKTDCRLIKRQDKYYLYVPEIISDCDKEESKYDAYYNLIKDRNYNNCDLKKINNKKIIKKKYKKENKYDNYFNFIRDRNYDNCDAKIINPITLDPGIRTFNTGITKNKVIKIGENCSDKIKTYLERKDKIINNKKINENIKKKNEKMINKKIFNLKNELHWKTIDYLLKFYDLILIGNMSSKSIIKKGGNLNKMTKRIASSLSFYEFKNRLRYKCSRNNKEFGEINEWMTSKMCSVCGNIKEDLGSNKVYNCNKCKTTLDRDVNGARNIFIKGISK